MARRIGVAIGEDTNVNTRESGADPAGARSRSTAGRWFYVSVTLLVIVLNIVAFSPSIVDVSTRTVPLPLTSIDLTHSLVSVAWLLVFLAQVTLVATGRPAVHRRLGVFGVLLSVAFIVVTWFILVEGARRGFDLSGDLVPRGTSVDPGTFLAPAGALVPLGAVVGAAVWYRQRPAVHKRLMMLALLTSTGAPIAHVVGHWPAFGPYALIRWHAHSVSSRDPRPRVGASHPPAVSMGRDRRGTVGTSVFHHRRADGRVARLRCVGRPVKRAIDEAPRLSTPASRSPRPDRCRTAIGMEGHLTAVGADREKTRPLNRGRYAAIDNRDNVNHEHGCTRRAR